MKIKESAGRGGFIPLFSFNRVEVCKVKVKGQGLCSCKDNGQGLFYVPLMSCSTERMASSKVQEEVNDFDKEKISRSRCTKYDGYS